MSERDNVNPRKIRSGPIRHGELPAELLAQIKSVHEVVGRLLGITLEQFEITFMRERHPEQEVAIWLGIVATWRAYHERHLNGRRLSDAKEKKILGALLSISGGIEDAKMLGVAEGVGQKLLQCYRERRP